MSRVEEILSIPHRSVDEAMRAPMSNVVKVVATNDGREMTARRYKAEQFIEPRTVLGVDFAEGITPEQQAAYERATAAGAARSMGQQVDRAVLGQFNDENPPEVIKLSDIGYISFEAGSYTVFHLRDGRRLPEYRVAVEPLQQCDDYLVDIEIECTRRDPEHDKRDAIAFRKERIRERRTMECVNNPGELLDRRELTARALRSCERAGVAMGKMRVAFAKLSDAVNAAARSFVNLINQGASDFLDAIGPGIAIAEREARRHSHTKRSTRSDSMSRTLPSFSAHSVKDTKPSKRSTLSGRRRSIVPKFYPQPPSERRRVCTHEA